MRFSQDQITKLAEVLKDTGSSSLTVTEDEAGTTTLTLQPTPLLTIDEAAEFLRQKPVTVRRMVAKGMISSMQTQGSRGTILFDREQLKTDVSRLMRYANYNPVADP